VLASPTVSYVGIDGKQNVLGEVNGRHIRVCFVEDKDRLLIITVINRGTRLSHAPRHWRTPALHTARVVACP